jgi:Hypoxia induced protein conserved region
LAKTAAQITEMRVLMNYLGYIAVGAVLVVLLAGLWNMMRGGSSSRSQNLMRWRVGLQFVAIIILMLGLYLAQR